MTATLSAPTDVLQAMAQTGGNAVAAMAGAEITVGEPVAVSLDAVLGTPGNVIKRSQLSAGQQTASLITIVPSSGLVSSDVLLDAEQLATTLVEGALAGIAQAGGPVLLAAPPEHVSIGSGVEVAGAEAFGFDLRAGARSITVVWVVEATLGSLLGGSIPVDGFPAAGPSVAPATLPELSRATVAGGNHDLEALSDVITNVSVEIARGSVQVRDLTSMTAGTVFQLDREAGDPVDILVNGSIVAQGDIVVVGNQLGIRITQIVEPKR